MIVCIAEKPSVARDIAHVLGATQMKQGYIEGNGYQITWTFGHLCELKEPDEYTPRWKRWDLYDLPMLPSRFGIRLKDDEGVKRQFAVIERLMQAAESIVNCGDAGQEGELIQRWVMQKAGAKCPVKRLWISSLTEEAIREGFAHLKDQSDYRSLYEAGLCRAIGDWTLGMNATRLYTLKYGQAKQLLSVGRVQTPTLALIVRRQQEIENFVPKQSWTLSTFYRDVKFSAIVRDEESEADTAGSQGGKSSKTPAYRPVEYATEQEGEAVLSTIKDCPFIVFDIQKKKGTEAPPRLYDLTSLQVACNTKFGYSADQTLQLIQALYEKKYTTYPRVDTTYLSDDIYSKCPRILAGLRGYESITQPLAGKPLLKSKKVFDTSKVTDHHAIIPTGVPVVGLSDMERNVYDLVTRAFIAVFYPDCKFEATSVYGRVEPSGGGDFVLFRTGGRTIIDEGWKVIYKKTSALTEETPNTAPEEERSLPAFVKGEQGPHIPSLAEKWTQPPKSYTEATLLRAMETAGKFVESEELREAMKENGIGRPSTRAAIIETLYKRRYIRKERKALVATPTGVELIGIIREELLKSAELTGLWEKKLREIERGTYDAATFVDELKQMVSTLVTQVRNDTTDRRVAVTTDEDLKKKLSKSSRTSSSPKSSQTSATRSSAKASKSVRTDKDQPANVPAGFRPKHKETGSKSTKGKNATEVRAAYNPDDMIGLPCPICRQGHIVKGKTAYGCSRWREGCTYRVDFGKSVQ